MATAADDSPELPHRPAPHRRAAADDRSIPPDPAAPSGPLVVRDARDSDVPELLEMFVELAEYEDLLHELQATEKQLSEALFGPRPAAEAFIDSARWFVENGYVNARRASRITLNSGTT